MSQMTRFISGAAVLVAITMLQVFVSAQGPRTAEVALRAAQHQEQAQGDLAGAIKQYQAIVDQYGRTDRAVAAVALTRMAECYEKLGDPQARNIWARVVAEFGDQDAPATKARARLALVAPMAATGPRLVGTSAGRLSSDERTMAVIEGRDVAIRDMGTGKITTLTVSPALPRNASLPSDFHWPTSPVLSSDSTQIAYGEIFRTGGAEFRLISNKPGATPRIVFRNPEFTYVSPQAWSLDGRTVLATMLKTDKTWQVGWISTVDGRITVLESLEWRFHDEYDVLNLSPDGLYIAYSALATSPGKPLSIQEQTSLQRRVYILASDGSSRSEVLTTADGRRPIWSPDSGHIVFLSDLSGSLGLWSVPVRAGKAAGTPSMVRAGVEGDIRLHAITRAGTLYYSRWSTGYGAITVSDATGRSARPSNRVVGFGPVWSADGKALAFLRGKRNGADGNNLVIHSVESSEERLFDKARITGPTHVWFRDGRRLIVPVTDGTQGAERTGRAWYAVDPTTGSSVEILPANRLYGKVIGLSSDDTTVYYLMREAINSQQMGRLMALDLGSRQSRQVFSFSSLSHLGTTTGPSTVLSPDGLTVATHLSDDNSVHLGLISLTDGSYRALYRGPKVLTAGLQWTDDGKSLVWGEPLNPETPSRGRMKRISVATGTVESTGLEYNDGFPWFSPDGTRVATEINVPPTQELWALDHVMPSAATRR